MLGAGHGVALLRREPYRLLFPLGALCAVAGTLPWLLFAAGIWPGTPRIFHALVQVQSFLACFIGGFLMTFVPRRTGAAPPASLEVALGALLPVALAVAAGLNKVTIAETLWLVWLLVLGRFVISRLFRAPASPVPVPSMVWIPLSLLVGIGGTIAAGVYAILGRMEQHDVAQRLVLQGMVAGLVMGVGSLLLPVLLRRDAKGAQTLSRSVHLSCALLFWVSYPLEAVSVRAAFAVRALVAGVVLVYGAQLWQRPGQPGVHIVLAWLGAWALPVGHAFVALFPAHRLAGLHIVFIGTFALMAFSIGAHVTFAHCNRADLLKQPWKRSLLVPFGVLLAAALVLRVALDWSGVHYLKVLTVSVSAFLAAVVFWLLAIVPVAARPTRVRSD